MFGSGELRLTLTLTMPIGLSCDHMLGRVSMSVRPTLFSKCVWPLQSQILVASDSAKWADS